MRELPAGTVTFLFTDVEGSTRLLHELGAAKYAEALAEHRRVIREAFTRHGGVEVDTQGDAFFVAFPTAPGAVAAVSEMLAGLARGSIRVRMGLHTGTPYLAEEGYVGTDVNRAARIAACGHGGQVLVSASTASLLGREGLRDLGEHRLKDLSAPERIFQLGEGEFPPLQSLHQTNLPVPMTTFVGRDRELAEVSALLARDDVRLLTLTGPGGTGKTRLALQAAAAAADRYRDGVFWVPLAPLRDPKLVVPSAAHELGATAGLAEHVADKRMLLFFDNFEHVIDAAGELAAVLTSCPNLVVMVTSREPLHVGGEQEYAVPPLMPEDGVALFVTRATGVNAAFEPDSAVSEICRRLDDLPLALELAAARTKALAPAQILERLEHRLPLLTGGARDLPDRQRTLRATIAWSYDLLSEHEKRLFARLAVFRGGCALEAAEEVAGADVDTLQSLVDKSLLRRRDTRYWMLETIREFAAERLREGDEGDGIDERHFQHVLELCERAYEERHTSTSTWLPRVDAEHDNIRAALDWAAGRDPRGEAQLAGAVARYWSLRGRGAEALERLRGAVARYGTRDDVRARALVYLGAREDELSHLEEALALWRELGDPEGEALALETMGWTHDAHGDYAAARAAHEQSLTVLGRAGAPDIAGARARAGLCHVLVALGDVERAQEMAEELLDLAARHGSSPMEQLALHFLADCPLVAGEYAEAERRYRRALSFAHAAGLVTRCTDEVIGGAMALAGQGDAARAVRLAAAAHAEQEALGQGRDRWWATMQERLLGQARARLAPDELERAERAGRETPFELVIDELLS